MSHIHSVVWLDHNEARVIDFSVDDVHKTHVRHHGGHRQVHHKSGSVGAGHSPEDQRFFGEVVEAIGDAAEVLVVGPGQAKVAFRKFLDERHAPVARKVVGVESMDHPSDGELLAHARRFFKKADAMLGLPGQQ